MQTTLPYLFAVFAITYPPGEWYFYWHGDETRLQTAVESADEVDGIIVGVNQGDSIARLQDGVSFPQRTIQ